MSRPLLLACAVLGLAGWAAAAPAEPPGDGPAREEPPGAWPGWLQGLELHGAVAGSYLYNFVGPGPRLATGTENGPLSNPFHPDHNTLQLDEAELSLERPAVEPRSAGFALGVSYGRTAAVLGDADAGNAGNDFRLARATLEWRTPWRIHVSAGKFPTHLGIERVSAAETPFVTRGIVYTALQPRDQLGVRLSGDCGDCGVEWMLGAVNGFATRATDIDDEKELVWSLAYTWRRLRSAFQGQWGFDAESGGFGGGGPGEEDSQLVAEFLFELAADERSELFADLTFRELAVAGGRPWAVGAAVGGRRQLSDRFAASARVEYAHADADGLTFRSGPGAGRPANLLVPGFGAPEMGAASATLTVDLGVVGGLTLRTEAKYETVVFAEDVPDGVFNPDGATGVPRDDDQFLAVLQLLYAF